MIHSCLNSILNLANYLLKPVLNIVSLVLDNLLDLAHRSIWSFSCCCCSWRLSSCWAARVAAEILEIVNLCINKTNWNHLSLFHWFKWWVIIDESSCYHPESEIWTVRRILIQRLNVEISFKNGSDGSFSTNCSTYLTLFALFRILLTRCLIKFSIILPPNVPRVLIEMSKNNYGTTMKYLKKHVNEVFIMLWHWHFCWIRYLRYLFHTLFRPFFLFFK